LVLEADVVERGVGALHRRAARQARELPGVDAELDGGHAGEIAVGLGHVADAVADGEGLAPRRVAEDCGLALEGQGPEEELDERRLSGAVGTEEPDAVAVDGAAEPTQRLDGAVTLAHVAKLDQHRAEHTPGQRGRRGGGSDRTSTTHGTTPSPIISSTRAA